MAQGQHGDCGMGLDVMTKEFCLYPLTGFSTLVDQNAQNLSLSKAFSHIGQGALFRNYFAAESGSKIDNPLLKPLGTDLTGNRYKWIFNKSRHEQRSDLPVAQMGRDDNNTVLIDLTITSAFFSR